MPRTPVLAAGALLFAVSAGACTLSSDPASDSVGRLAAHSASPEVTGPTVAPAATGVPTLKVNAPAAKVVFEPATLKAEAGEFNVHFTTDGNHNFNILGVGIPEPLLWGTKGGSPVDTTHAVTLKAGTYEYYCSVPGHREAGMRGTLTVS